MSELKMPMPKLPEIQVDQSMVVEEGYEEVEEVEEGPSQVENAIASIIGFVSAFGLPQPWLSKKALEYKQAALDVGLAENLAIVLEKYFPQMKDSPEYALLLSILAFGALVISDRMELQAKLKNYKKYQPPENKEVEKNARPENAENVKQ